MKIQMWKRLMSCRSTIGQRISNGWTLAHSIKKLCSTLMNTAVLLFNAMCSVGLVAPVTTNGSYKALRIVSTTAIHCHYIVLPYDATGKLHAIMYDWTHARAVMA